MTTYMPAHFDVRDANLALALIREFPFATLVSGGGEPFVTHLPIVAIGDATAWHLQGHVAKANPHWSRLGESESALLMFHGPHGYVSPNWYETKEAVPTWNYLVVHVRAKVQLLHEADAKEAVLKRLIARVEPGYAAQWSELDPGFQRRMLDAIVGFRFDVIDWQAKFKLSQNRSKQDRANVVAQLSRGDSQSQLMATWMRRLGIGADA